MATLSETFLAGIQKQEGSSLDSSSGAAVGAQLAQLQQQKIAQRAALQKQAQELEQAKIDKIGEAFLNMSKIQGPMQKIYGEKYIPQLITSMGMQDKIHPLNMEAIVKDQQLAAGIGAAINERRITYADLQSPEALLKKAPELLRMGSMEQLQAVGAGSPEVIEKATKEAQNNRQTERNAIIGADAARDRLETQIDTAGSKKFDEKAGADAAKFDGTGGVEDAKKKIQDIDDVIQMFEKGEVKSGTTAKKALGLVPFVDKEAVTAAFDEKFAAAQAKSRSFLKLKDNLDSQFAQAEAEKQYNMRTINGALSKDENIKRLKSMRSEMVNDLEAGARLIKRYGRGGGSATAQSAPKIPEGAEVMFHGRAMNRKGLEAFVKNHSKDPRVPEARKLLLQLNVKK